MNIPDDHIINELVPKYIMGKISVDDQLIVEDWIKQDPTNQKILDEYKKVLDVTDKYPQEEIMVPEIDLESEWEYQLNLINKSSTGTKYSRFIPWRSTSFYRIAASIVLILGAVFIVYYFSGGLGRSYYAEIQGKEIELSDGTVVTLNLGSDLSYRRSYNKKDRLVEFEGEAYFDVASNPEKPFIIETSSSRIQVVGTSFNVRANKDEDITEVVVTSGKVLFQNKSSDKNVSLNKGDKGILNRQSGELYQSNNDNPNFLSWKTRIIDFNNSTLENVVKTLNEVYPDKQVKLMTSDTSNCSITVSFNNQSLESVLNVLESTLGLKFEVTGNTIEITDSGC